VSREIAAVVLRAMAPSRNERYRTAEDLALALDEATRGGGRRKWRRATVTIASGVAITVAGFAV
jgi:hypothetical protein